jgi:hypothetical protein
VETYNKYHFLKKLKRVFFGMLFIISLAYCDPEVDIEIPAIKKQLVVDGWIEQGNFAYVLLTYNTSYFSNIDSSTFSKISDFIATKAKVIITNGTESEIMMLDRDTNFFPSLVYRSLIMKGEVGKTYTLIIKNEGDTITASTNILQPVNLDSIWFESLSDNDTMGVIKGIIHDNKNERNFYKTFFKLNQKSRKYIPTLFSNFEDTYFNGERFTFALKRGPETYLKPIETIYFKKGDTIIVKVSSIEKKCYEFWRSYEDEILNSGNPFAANFNKITPTINNGLGIWCGYGSTFYRVIAK